MSVEEAYYASLFGAAVRLERKARGFAQEKFADHIGMDRTTMGAIERGERNLALANIMRILEGLRMQPCDFFKHVPLRSEIETGNDTELRAM